MYTFKEINDSLPEEKKRADGLWTQFVLRPLAVPFTYVALKLRLKANTVSYLSVIFSIGGGVLFCMKGFWAPFWGAVMFNIFSIFDCVDGAVARVTKTASPWGGWADAVMGFVAYCAMFLSMGVYIYLRTGWWWILLITGITSSANLLTRASYQAYKNIVGKNRAEGAVSFEQKLAETVGITGFMTPLILVFHCVWGQWPWGMLGVAAFNLAFYTGGCLLTIIKLARKVGAHDPQAEPV
ncbi:MAG: CDP-alcohol phosphatidyltransferase family protein [Treponema sp.]|nr:CDP-alcohol phosphatidyltransferase family protein [Treponema sp.]